MITILLGLFAGVVLFVILVGAIGIIRPILWMRSRKQAALTLVGGLVLSTTLQFFLPDPDEPNRVTSEQFGEAWPFTISAGTFRCFNDGPRKYVVLDDGNGVYYGINGTARVLMGTQS